MILVGVDVASEKHDAAILRDTGEVIRENLRIGNDQSGYKKLLAEIKKAEKLYPDDGIRIGLESTGVYSVALTEYLAARFPGSVVLINPVLTSMFELSIQVHYAKTDRTDALGICKFLARNQDIRPYTIVSYHIKELRTLYRERIKILKRLNQDLNRLKGQLHVVFPEFLDKNHSTIGNFELNFLLAFPTAESLKKMNPDKVVRKLSKVKYMRIDAAKAEKLINAAKSSVGSSSFSDAFVIRETVERIMLYRRQVKEIEETMAPIVEKEYPFLLTIKGIGAVTIGGFVGEIGDVSNYHGSDSIVALAGLNPLVYESGKYAADHTRISKKGSHYLRKVLYIATQSMYMHGVSPIYEFVNKKRNEGKRYVCALNHGARKLCNILFSMLKNKSEFRETSKTS